VDPERATWPIVVGGCYRSGTSLVRRLLNAHPRIHCGPEVKFFRDFHADYFGDPLHHLRFSTTARSLLPEPELLDVLGAAFIELHARAAARAGKPRWADKNPDNVIYLDDWRRLLGERWLLIHVVRNPLDTLASIAEVGFPLSIPAELDGRIALYRQYNEAALRFGGAHPEQYYRLSYERLVGEPEAQLSGMMSWLAETFDPSQLAFSHTNDDGLEDPKIKHTTEVHTDGVGRWHDLFDADQASAIVASTADLLPRLDPGWITEYSAVVG
jgi:Sulfotransferase family